MGADKKLSNFISTSYYYPAKFIPNLTYDTIIKYCKKSCRIFDPFAGSGVSGITAFYLGHKSVLWDLSPLLPYFVGLKLTDLTKEDYEFVSSLIEKSINYDNTYEFKWDNVNYWFKDEILDLISKVWAYFHEIANDKIREYAVERNKNIIGLLSFLIFPLLYASRRLSFADDSIPKLYKSKLKVKKIENLIARENPKKLFLKLSLYKLKKLYSSHINNLTISVQNKKFYYPKIYAPVDSYAPSKWKAKWPKNLDLIITSPPYMTAHEYIRSIKLELFLLGYSQDFIRKISSLEIPYRKPPPKKINSKTYSAYRNEFLDHKYFLRIYETYFKTVLSIFDKANKGLKKGGHLAIFVGNPKLKGIEIPIHEILIEHLTTKGFRLVEHTIDNIKKRKLFSGRKNSNPNGMKKEHLIVFKKTS